MEDGKIEGKNREKYVRKTISIVYRQNMTASRQEYENLHQIIV